MLTKCPPFRTADMKDPYFRRLSAHDKRQFWKIFNGLDIDENFKDLFERMTERDPKLRASLEDVQNHEWMKGEQLDNQVFIKELEARFRVVEKSRESFKSER